MSARFTGKAAAITGAGSGIGRAVALRLASEGAQVLALDISQERLDETAQLAEANGCKVSTRVQDVSKRADCFAAVEQAVGDFGRLDILGNVAGIGRAEHFTEISEESYRQLMGVNADGYFFMAQAAIPHLLETDGTLINIASNAGLMGQAYTAHYCMSKGAVVNFTRALAMEYAKTKIRINAIAPGGTVTNLTGGFSFPPEGIDFKLVMRYTGQRPMAQPDEIANVFAFLASDEASNVHGVILPCDGGLMAG
jgi:NAD(P)-dependent dehydrogenase (short-subunit alcohol dehydrogenase family)